MFAQQIDLPHHASLCRPKWVPRGTPALDPGPTESSFDLRDLYFLGYLFVITTVVSYHSKYTNRKPAGGALQQNRLLPSEQASCVTCVPSHR